MLIATLLSLGVVFVAELGDKSQLIAMTYALRHRWWVVLSGVVLGAMLVHGISVVVGHFLGTALPERPIAVAAGVAFICFAAWIWLAGRNTPASPPTPGEARFALPAVVSSVLLAELGDKTMLATVALASDHNALGVWVGATIGMVLADAVAIAVGTLLHRRLPQGFLHAAASVLFLAFGLWTLLDTALGWRSAAIGGTGTLVLGALIAAAIRIRSAGHRRAAGAGSPADVVATPTGPVGRH